MADNISKLYGVLKNTYELGSEDDFRKYLGNADNREALRQEIETEYNTGDSAAFDKYLGFEHIPAAFHPITDEDLADFQFTTRKAQRIVQTSQQAVRRVDARQHHAEKTNYGLTPGTIKLGQNRKVIESKPHYNLETGKMESTYFTEAGNEYGSRAGADIEQNVVDVAEREARYSQTLPGQLEDAYKERDRLNGELDKYKGEWVDMDGRVHYGGRGEDEAYNTLMAAYRTNEQRIIALEAERDDHGQTQFWRGFMDAAKNPSTLSFGMTDFQDMSQLMRIKLKMDNARESGQEILLTAAEEALLKNTMNNGYVQSVFGENRGFMYRAGGISMQALPFVAEFVATGGFKAVTDFGAKMGTKAAEKLALDGLKKTLMRNTGILAGDIAASFVMANTTGAARTGADIMERNMGHVTIGEDGQYQFEGGKSLGRSIYEGEVANTLEYYTEKLGEHLQLGNWIAKGADKMGLSKLSKAVNYLSNNKWLEKGGIQDYPSEVVEEQANLLLNAILVGDNNFSTDPDSEEWSASVFNPQTQLDIWGGMMFSIGLMQTPRLAHTGYNAAGYYAYKHATNVSDANAASIFGDDNWQMIKEQIDECDNDHIGEMLSSIVQGDMSAEQKQATLDYAGNLLKMRGFNNGLMAGVRGGEDFESEEGFISHGIDQSYQQGHEAQEPDDKKRIMDEAQAAENRLRELFDEYIVDNLTSEDADPMHEVNYMLSHRDLYSDEEIAATVDYYQKQAMVQGVMDAAADDVEFQVAKANAEVMSNTHKQAGQLIEVSNGDERYFVVGGDVAFTQGGDGGTVFDQQATGDALIVRNVETGEIGVKSPQGLSVISVSDPNISIQENETTLRQQLMQQHDDDITFGSPANEEFQLNDTVILSDGKGGFIEGEIGMMPSAVDSPFVVYTTDGQALQLTNDQLNRMIVNHNGVEVERALNDVADMVDGQDDVVEENATDENQVEQPIEENVVEQPTEEPEQPQTALDRIPVLQDESGQPVLNKKGKKQYQWHKASVADTADALAEITGGSLVEARDTATQMINQAKGQLEKIRKQKVKGDDPIEIAESRKAIREQEEEQQAVIKHWQDVNLAIQRKMQEEAARRQAEIEAAKSDEQRAAEAEQRRLEKERQEKAAQERRKKQIEEDLRNWHKPYQPLEQAKREMADDPEAMSVLSDTEPRSLDEWVSSLLRPQSLMWNDEEVDGRTVTGLQSELGFSWSDMQRFGALIGGKGKGKPFGTIVHEIWEDLPEGMKNQYTDQDVRNVLLSLFNESDSRRMRNLAAERRIEEARAIQRENLRREAEYEMEAWAEAHHLTQEEREDFEAFMEEMPDEVDDATLEAVAEAFADEDYYRAYIEAQDYFNNNYDEQNTGSQTVDSQHPERRAGSESEGGEIQVQGQSATEGVEANSTEQGQQGAQTDTTGEALSDDDVSAREQRLAERIENLEDDWVEPSPNGEIYHRTILFDGKHRADQISEPDAKGVYDSSYFMFDGQRFGDLQEVADYIDRQPIGATSSAEEIATEEGKVNTNPTEGQKEAGNYQKGHIKVDGYDISIENPKGSIRSGIDGGGQHWEVEMHNTYGYIRGTEGVDGDHIDVYLSDNPTAGNVYVVDQVNPETGAFDEHKVMYGFTSAEAARAAYLSNYSDGWQGLGAITEVSREDFKKWVQSSHRKTKPFAEYKSVKANNTDNSADQQGNELYRDGEEATEPQQDEPKRSARQERARQAYAERQWRRAHQMVADIIEKLGLTDKVTVVDNIDDLLGADSFSERKRRAKGWFDPKTGKIVIVLGNHRSPEDVMKTVLHEGVAHYGLRELFGEHFDEFLDNVYNNATYEVWLAIDEDKYGGDTRKATEEYLASLAENTDFERADRQGWWAKVKRAFLNMLGKLGLRDFNFELSDNDLRYILWRSYQNLANPGRYKNVFQVAADVNMKQRLGVGSYEKEVNSGEFRAAEPEPHNDGEKETETDSPENADGNRQYDKQGNPVDGNGNLIIEKVAAVDDITDKDFTEPTRTIELPTLPITVQNALSTDGRSIIIKKNIFERNAKRHSDLTPSKSREILKAALYTPTLYGKNKPLSRPNNWILINVPDGEGNNRLVVLEVNSRKDHVEIVHWHEIDNRGLEKIKKQAVREDGQLLILPSVTPEEAGALSSPTNGMLSDGKGSENIPNDQENGGENGVDDDKVLFRDGEESSDPAEKPMSMARQIYEDAVMDTGDKMMLTALLSAIGSKEARKRFKHKFSESWFDYSRSIKALQDAIEKATGRAVEGFEDVWKALNAKSSIDSVELQRVMNDYIAPLSAHVGEIIKGKKIDGRSMTIDDVEKYLNAVHGIERNEGMAIKQAQDEYNEDTELLRKQLESGELPETERKSLEATLAIKEARFKGVKNYMGVESVAKWWNQWVKGVERGHRNGALTDEEYEKARQQMATEYEQGWQYKYREKDYSGLTALFSENFDEETKPTEEQLEQAARDFAAEFENIVGKEQADELWRLVDALNGWSLKKSYESGLISKQQYEDTKTMYQHYVPLRGWHDDYAGDIYQYVSRGESAEVLQGVMKKAYGRKSRAARIFGTMAAMANTAIVQGNKNLVAQRFLNMAMNHTDSGLLMVSEQWYQKNADGKLIPQFPDLRADMTAEEMQQEIERFEERMKELEDAGEVETMKKKLSKELPLHMAKWQEQHHAVRVTRNGREYMVYVLGNPRAAEAFNGMLNPHSQPGAVSDLISGYMRFLAKMQTSLSPEFLVSNFQRDVTTAMTGAYVKFGKDYQKAFVKNLSRVMPLAALAQVKKGKGADQWAGIFSLLRKYDNGTLDMADDMERMFKEFIDHGGMTGVSHITRAEEYQASMEKVVKRMRQGKLGKVRNGWDAVGNAVELANKGIENATRFAAYMASRQQGKNVGDSIFDAKEASVNFNMKGSGAWGNMLARRLYLYVNPAMQALRMLGTWYENDPVVASTEAGKKVAKYVGKRFMKAAATTLAVSMGSALVNIWLSEWLGHGDDGDDDGTGDWWALSEWDRYNFANIINPFGKGYYHWSIPQELRPLWAIGQTAIDMMYGRITWQRGMHSMLLQLNNLSPLSFFEGGTDTDESIISSEIRTMTPSFVSSFTDAYGWNRDFLGRRITNQGEWNKNAPEWQRAGRDTPQWLIGASRQWNELTGGRRNKKSWADSPYLNPSAVYYVFTQQFGGIGSMGKRLFTAIDQWRDPEQDVELRNLPFVPKFYVETGNDRSKERVLNDKFWMYWNEFKDAEYELGRDRSDEKKGVMTAEERARTIEERKADGTYQRWQMIDGNALDYVYDKVRGTEREKEVRHWVVDALENGVKPDYAKLAEQTKDTEEGKMWQEAYDRQTTSEVESLTSEELMKGFDESADERMRRFMAKRISKDAGASRDPYGDKGAKEQQLRYQQQRTAEDVRDDALLLGLQEKARDGGDKKLADEISKERTRVHRNVQHLYGGSADPVVMRHIRESRKRLIEKYGGKRE